MITISTIGQAACLIGEVAGDLDHDDPGNPEIDLTLLDDRRFTSCGVAADGRAWLGIGHHPGPGIAAAVVLFLPCHVRVVEPYPEPLTDNTGCDV
jgi:hypothetical protein